MSAAALAAVTALDNAAQDFLKQRDFARAAEKRDGALAAAQALGLPDCAITAMIQARLAQDLMGNKDVLMQQGDILAGFACTERATELNVAAMRVLQRREAAGALRADSCRPEEVAWNTARLQHLSLSRSTVARDAGFVQFFVANAAPFLIYEAHLQTAANADMCLPTGADSDKVLIELIDFTTSAIELLSQPRPDVPFATEGRFCNTMRSFDVGGMFDAYPAKQRLVDAWAQLVRSGKLQRLNPAGTMAPLPAVLPRGCAQDGCSEREQRASQFKKCSACKSVVYCCKEHQQADWPAHKAACKAAVAAREAAHGCAPSASSKPEELPEFSFAEQVLLALFAVMAMLVLRYFWTA